METFTETQRLRQWWLWLALAISTAIMLGGLLIKGFERVDFVVLAIPGLFAIISYVIRLDTRIDADGIHYRYFPLTGWRTIPWAAIRSSDVRTYQFVGYGIRWDSDAWYYNVDGQWGLHITQKNGKRLVIGTQQPERLKHFLESIHSTLQ